MYPIFNMVVSVTINTIFWIIERTYQPGLSAMVQCFSLTTNQRTILFSLAFQRNEHGYMSPHVGTFSYLSVVVWFSPALLSSSPSILS